MVQFHEQRLKIRTWIIYTSIGWALGVFLVVLFAGLFEAIHYSGQVSAGIGMSIGMGIMQWIALKRYRINGGKWVLSSAAGFTISFLLLDGLSYFLNLKPEVGLPFATALGSFISGWLQYHFILADISNKGKKWVVYCVLGWVLAALAEQGVYSLPIKHFHLPRYVDISIAFLFILIGGPVMGLITGPTIVDILKSSKKAP